MSPGSNDSGAIAIIVAILLTVLLTISALVLDLGALRADHVAGKSIADMASAAAMVDYRAGAEDAAEDACEAARTYAVANLPGAPGPGSPIGANGCDDVFSGYDCDSTDPAEEPELTASYQAGDYRIDITLPVHDDNALMDDLDQGEFDGEICDRIGVRITRDRTYLFAPVIGLFEGTTTPGSVARHSTGMEVEEFASLVVLKRSGSQTLYTFGGSKGIEVGPITIDGEVHPGIISVDTVPDGGAVIDARGDSGIIAGDGDGDIFSYGLNDHDFDDVVSVGNNATVSPDPVAGDLVTRSPIDHEYNCQTGGYSAGVAYDPIPDQIPIDPCPAPVDPSEPSASYIGELHETTESVAASVADDGAAAGWHVDDQCAGTYLAGSVTIRERRLYLDCDVEDSVTLANFEHVIVNGGVNISNDLFEITETPVLGSGGTVLVLRDDDMRLGSQSELRFKNVFTYHVNGGWDLRGNAERMVMQAPLDEDDEFDDTDCAGVDLPEAGCFAPVAYWGNTLGTHKIRGGASGGIIGSVFTPNAEMDITPDEESPGCDDGLPEYEDLVAADQGSLNLMAAQIFAESYRMGGGAKLILCPSPDTTVGIPFSRTGLIR